MVVVKLSFTDEEYREIKRIASEYLHSNGKVSVFIRKVLFDNLEGYRRLPTELAPPKRKKAVNVNG